MAQRSFPFDAVDGDRVLDTAQWARLTAALAGDGVVPGLGSEMAVTTTAPESLAVRVSTGDYLIQGRHFQVHSEPETVTLDTAHATNPRIDRIVVRRHLADRTVEVGKVTGTAAVSPTPPALTRNAGGIWEDPLRQVFVRANATSVRASDQSDGQGYLSTDERVWAASLLAAGSAVRSWRAVTSGTFTGGTTFTADATAAGRYPAGTFTRMRLTMRGSLTATGFVHLRLNGDATADRYLRSRVTRRASDDAVSSVGFNSATSSWQMAEWGTPAGNWCQVELLPTGGSAFISMFGTGGRISGSDTDKNRTVFDGRTNTNILVSSLTVLTSSGSIGFDPVRWELEGFMP